MGKSENSNLHLTLEERRIIQAGIKNGSSKKSIADTLGKDKSTIGKEIKKHRTLKHHCNMPLECENYKKCVFGRQCTVECPEYIPFRCSRRDRSPGACNGCSKYSNCHFNKYIYDSEHAYLDYREELVDSRIGVNLTTSEATTIAETIKPLLKQGQSPYQIAHNHPELGICEKTLYNYIEGGVFYNINGITSMDLRRQVSRKIPKKLADNYKKRKDKKYLQGRSYKDYLEYMQLHPNDSVVQMDTVYNDETNGPFIQTFKFLKCGLTFAAYHDEKTASNMVSGADLLEQILGKELFEKYVQILLTDRGSEFAYADNFEKRTDGSIRTRIFYCDPMRSGQKGSLENKHIELRYICPKGVDLRKLGLINQSKMNLILSHINSQPLENLCGKTPLDLTEFFFPEICIQMNNFGIVKIPKDDVILKPYLLKSKNN